MYAEGLKKKYSQYCIICIAYKEGEDDNEKSALYGR